MNDWKLVYESFEPEHEGHREALCTLGNGYFATRGAGEETEADDTHYPGTYLAGGYNRLQTNIAGQVIENEDLVNLPNWLSLTFRTNGGDWFNLRRVEILSFRQELDLKRGTLERWVRFRDHDGRETSLISRRIVHMGMAHVGAIQLTLVPENWSGQLEIRSALDGGVINAGVKRYRQLNSTHLVPFDAAAYDKECLLLEVETNQSHLRIAQTARTRVYCDGEAVPVTRNTQREEDYIGQDLAMEVAQGQQVTVEKVVTLYTSRDRAISEPRDAAIAQLAETGRFDELFESHVLHWRLLWERCDIVLGGHYRTQMILRLHIFHLLQTVSPNTVDLDVGVPARGLHGEAYRGHIFWDELFILPFLNFHLPEISRALLLYRYRRLPEARRLAREAGFRGAMYPWQSGSSGREESQVLHLNPRSGRWTPDNTHLQRHVASAVAYNVWHYYESTGDRDFLACYGAEMIVEIARFWADAVTYDNELDRYEIRGVMGPDEFHDAYPWREEPGLDNNTYTNVMAVWVLHRAREALEQVGVERRHELEQLLGLSEEEIVRWEDIGRKMRIVFHGEGIISQFEGYERLEEFDWDGFRRKYGDIHRLDRILEAEGDSVNRYKASKQADVLMLFFLFSPEQLRELFGALGYGLELEDIRRNIDYYVHRTSNGSTLSHIVHSWVLARFERDRSWALFKEALEADIGDVQGGTTQEGIHLGAMAGSVDVMLQGQTGLEIHDDAIFINPCLPEELQSLRMRFLYRGYWLHLDFDRHTLRIWAPHGWAGPRKIGVRGQVWDFAAGEPLEVECGHTPDGWRPVLEDAAQEQITQSRVEN